MTAFIIELLLGHINDERAMNGPDSLKPLLASTVSSHHVDRCDDCTSEEVDCYYSSAPVQGAVGANLIETLVGDLLAFQFLNFLINHI